MEIIPKKRLQIVIFAGFRCQFLHFTQKTGGLVLQQLNKRTGILRNLRRICRIGKIRLVQIQQNSKNFRFDICKESEYNAGMYDGQLCVACYFGFANNIPDVKNHCFLVSFAGILKDRRIDLCHCSEETAPTVRIGAAGYPSVSAAARSCPRH